MFVFDHKNKIRGISHSSNFNSDILTNSNNENNFIASIFHTMIYGNLDQKELINTFLYFDGDTFYFLNPIALFNLENYSTNKFINPKESFLTIDCDEKLISCDNNHMFSGLKFNNDDTLLDSPFSFLVLGGFSTD